MSHLERIKDRHSDLDCREEVEIFIKNFYSDIAQDALLSHVYNDVAHINWGVHVPKIIDFWCMNLFGEDRYQGHCMRAHRHVYDLFAFSHAHYRRWLELFHENIDLGWTGPIAERTKRIAVNIAVVQSKALIGTALDVTLMPKHKKYYDPSNSLDIGGFHLEEDQT